MARKPEAQEAHAAQMEKVAKERHAENAGFYNTAGRLTEAAKIALGLEVGASTAQAVATPDYAGRGTPSDLPPWKAPTGPETMPRAMHGAQSVYAGKSTAPAKAAREGIRSYPSSGYDAIKRNSDLYKKWAGSAGEAQRMSSQAWRTGISPFAGKAVKMAGPAAKMAEVSGGGAATLAGLPGILALSEGGRAGMPYHDMHFNAFRLLERPLLPTDVGAEDYAALVNSPEIAKDLFSVGAISFELYQKAGNARVEAEVQEKEADLVEQYEAMSLGQKQQQDRLNAAREATQMDTIKKNMPVFGTELPDQSFFDPDWREKIEKGLKRPDMPVFGAELPEPLEEDIGTYRQLKRPEWEEDWMRPTMDLLEEKGKK